MYYGQAEQDKFVLSVLKHKQNGYFVEIGSNHPININNTYLLESKYNWKGVMVEYEKNYLPMYQQHRPNSIHVMDDATKVDYKHLFETNNFPTTLDYLQIDLEACNGSTIQTLQKLNNEVFDTYKFATVTFEHDIYHTNFADARVQSREIFRQRGYVRVFDDINNQGVNPYEDWYVHPDLVDMDYVNKLIQINQFYYDHHPITERTINWERIQYPQ
jgi:hypothetical protein